MNARGFTLIEVLFTLLIFSIGLLAVAGRGGSPAGRAVAALRVGAAVLARAAVRVGRRLRLGGGRLRLRGPALAVPVAGRAGHGCEGIRIPTGRLLTHPSMVRRGAETGPAGLPRIASGP